MRNRLLALLMICAVSLSARHKAGDDDPAHREKEEQAMQNVMARLTALEEQNRQLLEEVRNLRQQIVSPHAAEVPLAAPTLDERVQVDEQRLSEQAESKVEASQKFPLRLNGMLLFNAFANSRDSANGAPSPFLEGPDRSGATVRQTLLGLQFDGPHLPGNGRVNGDLLMDFWSGGPQPGDSWIRLRQATLSLEWANRTFSVGQNKPLISPYQPDSLAEVGIPPLAGAGNLWLWLPQARYEERIRIGSDSGVKAAAAVLQTDDSYTQVPAAYPQSPDPARPAIEGRASFWHKWDDERRIEIGSGIHASTSHIAGYSIPSRAYTADWFLAFNSRIRFSGMFYRGENLAGLGALNNSFYLDAQDYARPVQSTGAWSQLSLLPTSKLTWNIFAGAEQDRNVPAASNIYVRRLVYASNLLYHLGPNVVVAFEASQSRGKTATAQTQLQNHYDLAIGYLF